MNRVSTLIIGALFAIAAIEFGLLGASAAGLTGGKDGGLPPVSERVGVVATPTPLPALEISLSAPPYIGCNPNHGEFVDAFITTAGGQIVADGTEVAFSVLPQGTANPAIATTVAGTATSWVLPDVPSGGGITVFATSGFAEASVFIPCGFATPTMPVFVTVTPTPSPTPCDGPCPPTFTATTTWTPGPQGTNTPCALCPTATPPPLSPPPCDPEEQFCSPATPEPPPSPPSVDATGIDIRANPLTIECNGSDRSVVTVRLFDANGDPVPDGTWVYFSPYNGYADPWSAQTTNGYAKTQVSFYGDIFPYGPNLIVESGLLQAGIRIRCNPQSDPTPYPCNPSPGSDPLSPPCEPEPPCSVSPPSVSPPCEEPPQSPPTAFELRLDCDTDTFGIQTYCFASPSVSQDVAVVITNQSGSGSEIAGFNFILNNADISIIEPLPGVDTTPPNHNNNPDFNEAEISASGWECGPVNPDQTPGGPSSESLLSCFNGQGSVSIADGASLVLGVVHYRTGVHAGSTPIFIDFAAFYDSSFLELGSCQPTIETEMNCHGAVVEMQPPSPPVGTPTPSNTAFEMAIDCDSASEGIQSECTIEPGQAVDAPIVVTNRTSIDERLGALGFYLDNDDTSVLAPNASDGNPPTGRDGNPDFNEGGLTSPNWLCAPPTPSPDVTPGGPTSESFIGCFNGYPATAQLIAAGESIVIATVRLTASSNGEAHLAIRDGNLYSANFGELGTCNGFVNIAMACPGATITVDSGPTTGPITTPTSIATNTPVSTNTPLPTNTAPPTPTNVPTQTPAPPPATLAPPSPTRPARTATTVARTATVEPTRTPSRGNRCADVNDDGRVTRADIRDIVRRVQRGPYIAKYDINRNGRLGSGDVVAAIRQLGRRC